MTSTNGPTLTIIIVSYNSLNDLKRCLPSIYNQEQVANIEIIVVDNHGKDGVDSWIGNTYPSIHLIKNPINNGYAGGNNLGLTQASGEWILFLNPDTLLEPNCLKYLLDTTLEHPTAFLNPKLLNPDGTINACGNQMHYTGITTCRGINLPGTMHSDLEPVGLLSGAALMAPRWAIQKLKGFNEEHFMYFEDADLSLRALLAGYPLLCQGKAVITHYYRLGMNPTKYYYLERNRLLTLRRVLTYKTWKDLIPALILTEVLTSIFSLRGLAYLKNRFRVYYWLWRHRKEIEKQNFIIQKNRQLSDIQLLADATTSLPLGQLASGFIGRVAIAILLPIYKFLKPSYLILKP